MSALAHNCVVDTHHVPRAVNNRLALAFVLAAALCSSAHAVDVYKWKDSKGVVHYGDRPASGAAASMVNARDDKVDPDDAERARQRLSDVQDGAEEETTDEPEEPRHATSRKPAASTCAAAWQRYDSAQACFNANRVAGGKGVTSNGSYVCKEVPQPGCAR